MTNHGTRCIENARDAIAENNAVTEIREPGRELVSETDEQALVWLAEGTIGCYQEGDFCH